MRSAMSQYLVGLVRQVENARVRRRRSAARRRCARSVSDRRCPGSPRGRRCGRARGAARVSSAPTTGDPSGVCVGCTTIRSRRSYVEVRHLARHRLEQLDDLRLRRVEALLDAGTGDRTPRGSDPRRTASGCRRRLSALDAVDVQRRVARAVGDDRHRRASAPASVGCSSRRIRSRTTPMCSTALTP